MPLALLLDIQAAFPNMREDRLIANMKNRNISDEYRSYVCTILTQRQVHLKFDDQLSDPFSPHQTTDHNRRNTSSKKSDEDITRVHKEGERLQKRANPNLTITFTWVAGHMGSEGNEAADELAKGVAEFGSSDQRLLPKFLRRNLPISQSATIQQLEEQTN